MGIRSFQMLIWGLMLTSPSAATAQSPGPITNGILRRNDFAGYGIFPHASYQRSGLIPPAHEKLNSSISRSGSARAIGGALEGRPSQASPTLGPSLFQSPS